MPCPEHAVSRSLNRDLLVVLRHVLARPNILGRLVAELEILLQRNSVLDAEEDDRGGDEEGTGDNTPL